MLKRVVIAVVSIFSFTVFAVNLTPLKFSSAKHRISFYDEQGAFFSLDNEMGGSCIYTTRDFSPAEQNIYDAIEGSPFGFIVRMSCFKDDFEFAVTKDFKFIRMSSGDLLSWQ